MEVRIGPKSVRSDLPVGYVPSGVLDQIKLADSGQLGKQVLNFDVRLTKPSSDGDAHFKRVFVINGHCRFKLYTLIDVVRYKLVRMLGL